MSADENFSPDEFSAGFDLADQVDADIKASALEAQLDQAIRDMVYAHGSAVEGYIGDEEMPDEDTSENPDQPKSINRRRPGRVRRIHRALMTTAILYGGSNVAIMAHDNFKSADCVAPADNVDFQPESSEIFQEVAEIDFTENDMSKLQNIRDEMRDAKDLQDVKSLATKYLASLDIDVRFDKVPTQGLRSMEGLPYLGRYKLQEADVDEELLREQVYELVNLFAATPRSLLNSDTAYYLPDDFNSGDAAAITSGEHGRLLLVRQDDFIIISLSKVSSHVRGMRDVYWHETFHDLDKRLCSPKENDRAYRATNPKGFDYGTMGQPVEDGKIIEAIEGYVVPYDVAEQATRRTLEDKAIVFSDMMHYGISPPGSDRGDSPMAGKQQLLVGRIVEHTGLTQLPALIKLMSVYDANQHPLEVVRDGMALSYDPNPDALSFYTYKDAEVRLHTGYGDIIAQCNIGPTDVDPYLDQMCAVSLTGADLAKVNLDADTEEGQYWYSTLQLIAQNAVKEQLGEDFQIVGIVRDENFDTDYPQKNKVTFTFQKAS